MNWWMKEKSIKKIILYIRSHENKLKLYKNYLDSELLPWQKDITGKIQVFSQEKDQRHLLWICDTQGVAGKAFLAKYIDIIWKDSCLLLSGFGCDSTFPEKL